jgi:hypothetical protein
MRKLFVVFIIIVLTVIASMLYGAHNMVSERAKTLFLEQAYMAQYPVPLPPIVMD